MNIITDLDWLYCRNSDFIIILEIWLLNIDWRNVWQWWMLMITDWEWVLLLVLITCKMRKQRGHNLLQLCEILTFNNGTVLDILLLDNELVKYMGIITQTSDCWLVLWISWLISWTINVLFPLIISFSANYNPLTYPIFILSPHVLILITTKKNYVLDWIEVAEFYMDWSEVYWFYYSWLFLSLSSDHISPL